MYKQTRGATANVRTQREARDAGAAHVPAFQKVANHNASEFHLRCDGEGWQPSPSQRNFTYQVKWKKKCTDVNVECLASAAQRTQQRTMPALKAHAHAT